MSKEEIVLKFLRVGKLLTPRALESATAAAEIPNVTKLVLDETDFLPAAKVRVIKTLEEKPGEITTEDFVRFYKSKYEKMASVIMSRVQKEFVSLNKMPGPGSEVCIIGMVKDAKESSSGHAIELEDMTGTRQVVFSEPQKVELDDVIAVSAVTEGNTLIGRRGLYPDIPLRPPAKGRWKGCFVSDLHLKESPSADVEKFFAWLEGSEIQFLFIAGGADDAAKLEALAGKYLRGKSIIVIPGEDSGKEYPQLPEKFTGRNIISLSNPALVEAGGLKVLLVHKFSMDMLKKRYLGKSNAILPEDYLVLDEVPDIVHCGSTHQPHVYNYKSVTIVNSGSLLSEFRPVIINFETREVEQATVK